MTRRGVLRAAGHAVAYLALLVGLLALTDLHVGWNLDDGAYAVQTRVLEQTGEWAYPYRHRDVDPGSRFAPVSHSWVTERGTYPYVRFPAWIWILRGSTALFGDFTGLYVPAVLGAVFAALTGGLLARALRSGTFALGFWATGLGPLVVHSQALWAQTWLAAMGGAVALVLVALAAGRTRAWHPFAVGVMLAGGCLLRREPLLLAVAIAVAGAGAQFRLPGPMVRRLGRAAWWAGPPLVGAVVATFLNGRWVAHLTPGGPPVDGPGVDEALPGIGFVDGRFRGALRTLIDGVGAAQAGTVLGLLVVGLAVAAGVALASGPRRRAEGVVLAVAAVAVTALRVAVAPADLAGFVVAMPLVAVGAGAWRWRRAPLIERMLVVHIGLYVALVLATQYPEGGSRDWGGRFLFPVLIPAVVLAAVTVIRALDVTVRTGPHVASVPSLRRAGVALAGILLAVGIPTAAGLLATRDLRASNQASTDAALAAGAPTVIRMPRYLTRVSWRELPGQDWLSAEPETAAEALALLRPGRVEPVALLGPGADRVRAPGWRRTVRSPQLVVFVPR